MKAILISPRDGLRQLLILESKDLCFRDLMWRNLTAAAKNISLSLQGYIK
jgi:hypothetical protein